MNERLKKIEEFNKFKEESKKLFESYAERDGSHKKLKKSVTLYILPGGRGLKNEKVIEVFYGLITIGRKKYIAEDFKLRAKRETAHGAMLSYRRTDNGNVICMLFPAGSDNFSHPEDGILIEILRSPSKLRKKSKKHWNMFIAYMEATFIDGKASLTQRIRVFYLRASKQLIKKNKLQEARFIKGLMWTLSYFFTIGLSGFLILLITWGKGCMDKTNMHNLTLEKLSPSISELKTDLKEINKSLQKIAQINKEINMDIEEIEKDVTVSKSLLFELSVYLKQASLERKINNSKEKTLK